VNRQTLFSLCTRRLSAPCRPRPVCSLRYSGRPGRGTRTHLRSSSGFCSSTAVWASVLAPCCDRCFLRCLARARARADFPCSLIPASAARWAERGGRGSPRLLLHLVRYGTRTPGSSACPSSTSSCPSASWATGLDGQGCAHCSPAAGSRASRRPPGDGRLSRQVVLHRGRRQAETANEDIGS